MIITICAGSSCHHRQSEEVIPYLQQIIELYGLESDIVLKASFCMGKCSEGFNLKIDDQIVTFSSSEQCRSYLRDRIRREFIDG